jgi:Gnt-I system high-affinity gluconate transporter
MKSHPLETFQPIEVKEENLPGTFSSFFVAVFPVALLMLTTFLLYLNFQNAIVVEAINFLNTPAIVMLLAVAVATYLIGIKAGKSIKEIMTIYELAVKDVAMILLIFGAAGALKQVLAESGVDKIIGAQLQTLHLHPLVLGWVMAAIIRACLGSSTIAGLTAAGILAPVIIQTGIDPNLMVLAVGAGSLAFSHVNDTAFWMFKEFFNLTLKDTFRSWAAMETIVALCGLGGVLLLDLII